MTTAIVLLLASLLIIGIFRKVKESQEKIPTEQITESTVQSDKITGFLSEPFSIENPPNQEKEKKLVQKKLSPVKKSPIKKPLAKNTPSKKNNL